jgi:hypothetical protein
MFFILSFLFFHVHNWRTGGQNKPCPEGSAGSSRRRELLGKGDMKVNMIQKMCMHVGKCKNDNC